MVITSYIQQIIRYWKKSGQAEGKNNNVIKKGISSIDVFFIKLIE